eukprot:Hpha_TRINITY_DN24168_c0_g1::TRINITY_DN24168_c0_g1_i1::g.9730::m.9730
MEEATVEGMGRTTVALATSAVVGLFAMIRVVRCVYARLKSGEDKDIPFARQPTSDPEALAMSARIVMRRQSSGQLRWDHSEQRQRLRGVIRRRCVASADAQAAQMVADRAELRSFKQGDVILRQGEPGHSYFVIAEGHCDVSIHSD